MTKLSNFQQHFRKYLLSSNSLKNKEENIYQDNESSQMCIGEQNTFREEQPMRTYRVNKSRLII